MKVMTKFLCSICVLLISVAISNAQDVQPTAASTAVINIEPPTPDTPEADLSTLKLVQLVFRHGDRTPEYPWPRDAFSDESIWPEGWAQLTNEGKQQEYQLGKYLRRRYGDYLNSTYIPNQVYAISSDTDRTIMSGLLALAGLYPTENVTTWDSNVNWQPIPIHTVFTEDDNLIRFKRDCPKFNQLLDDFLRNSPLCKKLNEDNKQLYETLSRQTGVNITTINDIDKFYASMFVEEYKGLNIPEWGKVLRNDDNFQYLYNLSYKVKTYNTEMARLRAGELVKYLTSNINERVRNESSKTKMFVLSGHDITLIDILNTFGVFDLQRPWYSSVFMLELHQEAATGNFFLELYFRNDTSRPPYKLSMPGCDGRCTLEYFLNYTKPLIPGNWDEECQLTAADPEQGWSTFTYVLLGLGGVAAVVFIGGLCCMTMKKKRRNRFMRNEYQNF